MWKRNFNSILLIWFLVFILILPFNSIIYQRGSGEDSKTDCIRINNIRSSQKRSPFEFRFQDPEYNASAIQYDVPLDLSKVNNLDDIGKYFYLNQSQKVFLKNHGFVGTKGQLYYKFTDVYEYLYHRDLPIFVTTDSLLHSYHTFFDDILKVVEEEYLVNMSKNLTIGMLEKAKEQYNNAKGEFKFSHQYKPQTFEDGPIIYTINETINLKEIGKKNVAYFSVALKLIDPKASIPSYVNELVNQELKYIDAHGGYIRSPLFDKKNVHGILEYKEDYSQYRPRGHYTKSEALENYFRIMMWYGRMGFRAKSAEETVGAILITEALKDAKYNGNNAADLWWRIYDITSFFVGTADDLIFKDYASITNDIYGELSSDLSELINKEKLLKYLEEIKKLRAPRICSSLVYVDEEDLTNATIGFRFMGQRFIPESYIFQELVFPKTGLYLGSEEPFSLSITPKGRNIRGMPRGFDVMGVLGSEIAVDYLIRDGDIEYVNFSEQFDKLEGEFSEFNNSVWSQNLYWGWLHTLKSLNENFSQKNYPTFMRNRAWQAEKLNTNLASWAELRHDTILYGKQSTTGTDGTGPPAVPEGYVEPIPKLFSRLVDLTNATINGLTELSVLSDSKAKNLSQFRDLLIDLKSIAIKELQNKNLSESDIDLINNIGEDLFGIMYSIDKERHDSRIIADVHSDPNMDPADNVFEKCLEVGVGYVDYIIVIIKRPNGELDAVVGPIFSYYEFRQPMSSRLTDDEWKEILEFDNNVPAQFNWMDYPPDFGSIRENIPYVVDIGLSSKDISISNSKPIEGETIQINASIQNFGNCYVNADIKFYNNQPSKGNQIGNKSVIVPISNHITSTIFWNTTGEEPGIHDIHVVIDKTEPIDDKKSNNIASKKITITLLDSDGDGYPDKNDTFPFNSTEWVDFDNDGYGDNIDAFPKNSTEWIDSDKDGYGDNSDVFPNNSTEWCDSDGDGYGDNSDKFPFNPYEWLDSDGDGYGDNTDAFSKDPFEWSDTDNDGYGDRNDKFPNDPYEWIDTDGDGIGNNSDLFPNDPFEWNDTDGDSVGDNSDRFPNDPTQWLDSDGDNYGDNPNGTNSDYYPYDPYRWKKEEEKQPEKKEKDDKEETNSNVIIIIAVNIILIIIFIILFYMLIKKKEPPK